MLGHYTHPTLMAQLCIISRPPSMRDKYTHTLRVGARCPAGASQHEPARLNKTTDQSISKQTHCENPLNLGLRFGSAEIRLARPRPPERIRRRFGPDPVWDHLICPRTRGPEPSQQPLLTINKLVAKLTRLMFCLALFVSSFWLMFLLLHNGRE